MIGAVGGLTFPVAATAVTDSLAALDPARHEMAGLLAAAINGELGAPWAKIVATLPTGHILRNSKPVQDVVELEPDATTLGTRRTGWPLLAVYRQGKATVTWKFEARQTRTQRWNVDYVLGPLALDDVRKVGDILTAAGSVIGYVLMHGYYGGHPSASPPVAAYGTGIPWAIPVSSVHLVGQSGPGYAKAEGMGGEAKDYYGITFEVETTEVTSVLTDPATDTTLDNTGSIGPTDITIGLAVDPLDGVTIPSFVKIGPPV
jgi:hypothetical protein